MPLPLFAAIAGGVLLAGKTAINVSDINDAKESMQRSAARHEKNVATFEKTKSETTAVTEQLGQTELEIMTNFKDFHELWEQIKNAPELGSLWSKSNGKLTLADLQNTYVSAGGYLGGEMGAAVALSAGISGAVGAIGALTGTAILGAATLGIGLVVGSLFLGGKAKEAENDAYETRKEVDAAEEKINKICEYLNELSKTAENYHKTLQRVNNKYQDTFGDFQAIVFAQKDYNKFTEDEQIIVENTVMFVEVLYNMCQTPLVIVSDNENELNKINHNQLKDAKRAATEFLLALD
ncbi:MAG: hypothetical protein FWG64_03465 [Firmicutes bacterium]|nr:hypothetical protein [Bacillota bacterium]